MDLSVVVPTLNGRDQLAACLDALAAHAPRAEVIVVNGPSADGTTGMVRDRDDIDVLVETSDRTVNVARNAGIEVATGDVLGLVDYDNRIGESWVDAVAAGLERGDVVTGPVRRSDASIDGETDEPERRTIAGRDVTYFAGGNVAFRRSTIRDLDGFDEYLHTGGARDAAHRLSNTGHEVVWEPELAVTKEIPTRTAADGGRDSRDWGWKYRALSYRLLKNYGLRPTAFMRTASHAVSDAVSAARDVVRGDGTPSRWLGNGRDVVGGIVTGSSDGMVARAKDRSPARNPHGLSKRADRAVATYDERSESPATQK